jgi:hypothetical protein
MWRAGLTAYLAAESGEPDRPEAVQAVWSELEDRGYMERLSDGSRDLTEKGWRVVCHGE